MQAVVAVAAIGLVVILAEVAQDVQSAAGRTFGVGNHLLHQLAGHLLFGGVLVGEELVKLLNVLLAVEGDASSFASVAAGTSGFLIVALDAFGDVVVDDKAHVGFVDAHAESDGGHDDIHLLGEEFVLVFGSHFAVQSRVVGQGFDAVDDQQLGQVFHFLACQTIDDAALVGILLDEADNLLVELHSIGGFGSHLIIEIGAVEARDEGLRLLHPQVLDDVLLHLWGGRGGKGQDGSVGTYGLDGFAQTSVFGTEVMAPLRDAMGLVNGKERNGYLL